ncbi:MAG: dTDP-4-dehydrorhamnose reductase [Alphaproteobacteria bacterium]|nr:dTDP-4-dehydrorhamnose reductase [Alphaproteobacteria bacterium]
MKILLFGGTGQLGFDLYPELAVLGDVIVPGWHGIPRVDLTDARAVEQMIERAEADIVVNAAAYTAVDKAESDQAVAHAVNAVAPGVMARQVNKSGGVLFHYSTDYVFDGAGQLPHLEEEQPRPLNVYGLTKRGGEIAIQKELARHYIFRTSWVYSPHGKNFPKTMIELARERDSLNIVCDQFGVPTHTRLLAGATAHVIRGLSAGPSNWGLYHLTASGETNWHAFAKYVLEVAAAEGLISRVPHLKAISSAQYPQIAKRPQNSRLSNSKFQNVFGLVLPHWTVEAGHFVQTLAMIKK